MQFKWYQNNNVVTITFQLPPNAQKAGLDVQCTGTTIRAGLKGASAICEGTLYAPVKAPPKWDVSSGKVTIPLEKVNKVRWPLIFGNDGKKRVKVVYDYDAQEAEELSFKEGDIVIVVKEDPTGWWKGELNGQVGTFPMNFVEAIPDVVPPSESPEPPGPALPPPVTPIEPEPVAEVPEPQEEVHSFRVAMPGMTPTADGVDPMAELKNRLQKRPPATPGNLDDIVKNRKHSQDSTQPEFLKENQLKKRTPEKTAEVAPVAPIAPVKAPVATKTGGGAPLPVKRVAVKNEVAPPVKNEAPPPSNLPIKVGPAKVAVLPVKKTNPPATQEEGDKSSFIKKAETQPKGQVAPAPKQTSEPPPIVEEETEPPKRKTSAPKVVKAPKTPKAKATFQYDAQDEGELGFLVGDIIEVKSKTDSGWWQGELNGSIGWFPASFVEDFVEPDEIDSESLPLPPPPVVEELDVGSKLNNIISDAPRLAAPKRSGGASGRRAPSRRKTAEPKESEKVVEKPKAPAVKQQPEKTSQTPVPASIPAPITTPVVKEPVKTIPPPVKNQPPQEPQPKVAKTRSLDEPKNPQPPPVFSSSKSVDQSIKTTAPRTIGNSGVKGDWPSSLPNFADFCKQLVGIFENAKAVKGGNVSNHYSHLSHIDPEAFSFAVVGVDGSQFSHGGDNFFALHGSIWPFLYGISLETLGEEKVSSLVGTEVTPAPPHALLLNGEKKPHNPFVNSGAMLISNELHNNLEGYQRISHVLEKMSVIAGGKIGCNMPSYLSMSESADKDLALGYWLRSNLNAKISDPRKMLDFYFQVSSIETNSLLAAQLAATLASEGVSPITGAKGLDSKTTKKLVSLLYLSGMNDDSSQWIEQVGLCAKSSVTGCILLVIPRVCGICVYSPRVDTKGLSVRGSEFCKRLVENFASLSGFKF